MRSFTIKSRDFGTVKFTGGGAGAHTYVWCVIDGGKAFQPCKSTGSTLMVSCGESFEKVCLAWWRAHLRSLKAR